MGLPGREEGRGPPPGLQAHGAREAGRPAASPVTPTPKSCSRGLPGDEGAASAAGDVPNSLEMMLRRGAGAAGGGGASAGAGGQGQAEGGWRGSCGAGWGVLGLELPVDTVLGGTTGDWEPEDGLCPLAASGDAWPRLRASIISRKLGGHRAGSEQPAFPWGSSSELRVTAESSPSGLSALLPPRPQAEHHREGAGGR